MISNNINRRYDAKAFHHTQLGRLGSLVKLLCQMSFAIKPAPRANFQSNTSMRAPIKNDLLSGGHSNLNSINAPKPLLSRPQLFIGRFLEAIFNA